MLTNMPFNNATFNWAINASVGCKKTSRPAGAVIKCNNSLLINKLNKKPSAMAASIDIIHLRNSLICCQKFCSIGSFQFIYGNFILGISFVPVRRMGKTGPPVVLVLGSIGTKFLYSWAGRTSNKIWRRCELFPSKPGKSGWINPPAFF